ncbi:MAG TPA: tetratricopeptide repeat protein, partial [Planctomycetota bacterium]|nr:tetratricopeptide repeat protein [Planctomycetota bacterium]
ILTKGQKRLLGVLLAFAVFMVANAAYLWLSPPEKSILPAFYQWMLVLHVGVGLLILLPMVVFVVAHLPRALAMRNRRAIWTGVVITATAFALVATGFFIFERANSAENRWAFWSHRVLALVVPAAYGLHRFWSHFRPTRRVVLRAAVVPVLLAAAFLAVHRATLPETPPEPQAFVAKPPDGVDPWRERWPEEGASGAPPASVFFPAATRSITGGFLPANLLTNADVSDAATLARDIEKHGFAVEAQIGAAQCLRCHQDIVEQWAASAHRYSSFNNPFYRAAVEDLREEPHGRKRSNWCAGCHDPAIMMAGNMEQDIRPEIPESQAGLTCLACHQMDEVHGVGGNGNYRIADERPSPYLFAGAKGGFLAEVHDLLVKSKPDVHKRDMLKPVFRTSEYCGTCHKVSLDTAVNNYRWFRGQNEYDAHQDSGVSKNNARTFYLPEKARSCQDCHMPLEDAPLGDVAAKNGKVRSHRFLGPNTALPHVRGDAKTLALIEEFRKNRLRVDVFAVRVQEGETAREATAPDHRPVALSAGRQVEMHVVVRNRDVGHAFPGGTLDSNEAWVRVEVFDESKPDAPLFVSGEIDPATKRVDAHAHFYRVVFVDEQGREAHRRNPQDFRAAAHLKTIGPGTADVVRYSFTPPADATGKVLKVRAAVMWRKFNRAYTEYAWSKTMPGRPVPDLPVSTLASGEARFAVVAGDAPEPAQLDPVAVAKDWTRWNDYGIGLLLQGDTLGAEKAFRRVAEAAPDRVDGWRNMARAALADGASVRAIELLQEAEKRKPGDPQTAYFFGEAREKTGQLDEAVHAYARAAQVFPDDRTIHQKLGQIRYRQGKYEEALLDNLRVLAIDPEDRTAHHQRMLIYRALGDESAAAEANKAYRKYQIDESAQKWTNAYRLAHPEVNFESQLIHVHALEPRR